MVLNSNKLDAIKSEFPKYLLDKELLNKVLDVYISILKHIEDELDFKVNYAELEAFSEDIYYIFKIVEKMGYLRDDLGIEQIQSNLLRNMDDIDKFNLSLFKRNRSTPAGIKFLYNMMKKTGMFGPFSNLNAPINVIYNENQLRTARIETDIPKALYYKTIGYSTHPLGYALDIFNIIYYQFTDQVLLKKTYKNPVVKVNCSDSQGNLTTVFNPLEAPHNYEIVNHFSNSNGTTLQVNIEFSNGYKLIKQFNGDIVLYDDDGNLETTYPGINCALYFNPGTVTLQSRVKDTFVATSEVINTDQVNNKKDNVVTLDGGFLFDDGHLFDGGDVNYVYAKDKFNIEFAIVNTASFDEVGVVFDDGHNFG